LTSTLRAMIRFEAINATNTPKFLSPNMSFGSAAFGRITGQAGFPRQLQVMIRLFW
jgi:trimeric autotransporter adhesin